MTLETLDKAQELRAKWNKYTSVAGALKGLFEDDWNKKYLKNLLSIIKYDDKSPINTIKFDDEDADLVLELIAVAEKHADKAYKELEKL